MREPAGAFGEFLRASRAAVVPAAAGLVFGGRRRSRGLRQDEVAVLAGVSTDYYARLEQGRVEAPTLQILGAVGRALRLDADGRGRLYRLSGMNAGQATARGRVHPGLVELLDAFPAAAAFVLSPALTVLTANPLAVALFSPLGPGPNLVRSLLVDPVVRSVFVDPDSMARGAVQALHRHAARFPAEPEIAAVVRDLLEVSAEFRLMWEEPAVIGAWRGPTVFVHPQVGRVELTYQHFDLRDAPGQQLWVGTPSPGSAAAVARLR